MSLLLALAGASGTASSADLAAAGGTGTFSGSASGSAPCDVRVSWLTLDTAATPCDVRVSWVCFDSAVPQAASTAFIEVGGGMTRAKAAALMRKNAEDDGDVHRITRQNQLIIALVTAAVTEGLLV